MNRFLKLSLSQYLVLGSQLVTGPLLARALGPSDRGVLAVVLVVFMITSVLVGLGSHAGFRRLVAGRVSIDLAYRYLNRWFIAAAAFSIILAAFSLHLFNAVNPSDLYSIAALIATSALAHYRNSVVAAAVPLNQLNIVSRNSILNGITTLTTIAGLFLLGQLTFQTAVLTYLLATLVSTAPTFKRLEWQQGDSNIKPSFTYALSSLPGQLGEIALLRLDQLVVPLLISIQGAGYYAIAFSYAFIVYPLLHSMSLHAAAKLTNGKSRGMVLLRALGRIVVAGLALALASALAAQIVIPLLFGQDYQASVGPACILLISVVAMAVSTLLMQINSARGFAYRNSISSTIGASATLLAAVFLAPPLGLPGIAISSTIGTSINLIVQLLYARVPK